jgi:predicted nucleic acid-binding protein
MRILFDTNVLVDAAVQERPDHRGAVLLINEAEQGRLSGVMAPLSLGTLWDLGTEHYRTDPRPLLRDLRRVLDLAPMGRSVLNRALDYETDTDFEDMYLAEAGRAAGASGIVTRNETDFAPTELTAYHPRELVDMLL